MKTKKICHHCGQAMMQYTHTITKGLAMLLLKACTAEEPGKPFHAGGVFKEKYSDRSNFVHLKYWGLIEKWKLDGKHAQGMWRVTQRGASWMAGGCTVPETVKVYNNTVVEQSEKRIAVSEVSGEFWKTRDAWLAGAEKVKRKISRIDIEQGRLFK